jgi:hypothetical protein
MCRCERDVPCLEAMCQCRDGSQGTAVYLLDTTAAGGSMGSVEIPSPGYPRGQWTAADAIVQLQHLGYLA